MKEDQLGQYYEEETYSKGLSREDTIEKQVRICALYYSKGEWLNFEYSEHMLIALLPKTLRDQFTSLPINIKDRKNIDLHYKQFIDIQESLELDTPMIFKKRSIKTYK